MTNQIIQESKNNPKRKSIISLFLGVVSIVFIIFACMFPIPGISMIIIFGAFLLTIIGLISGVGGLSSKEKNLAIVGIILCIASLLIILRTSGFLGESDGAFLMCPF